MPENLPTSADPNEFSTEAIALQMRPPARLARGVTLTLCVFALLAIVYAWLAHMDIVVTAPGRIVPSGKAVVVQPHEPGIVRIVHVRDGSYVRKGDLLVEMASLRHNTPARPAVSGEGIPVAPPRPAGEGAPRALLDMRLLESLSKLATLDAEVTRRQSERDAVGGALEHLSASLALVKKKHAMRARLARSGHMTEANLIESKLELINLEKEINAQRNRLQEADAALSAAIQGRTQAETEHKARFPAELVEVARRAAAPENDGTGGMTKLTAPADGVVQWLAPLTAGEAVSAAQNLLVIVPENAPLEVEALVFNKDIGHLRAGQPAVVKIETFDYTRYGHVEGGVQWVGADAVADPKLGPVYATRVALKGFETPNIVNGRRGQLAAGMNVTVDVRVAERRMIEYFLAPLLRYKEESLRER
jgi:hemolysin D